MGTDGKPTVWNNLRAEGVKGDGIRIEGLKGQHVFNNMEAYNCEGSGIVIIGNRSPFANRDEARLVEEVYKRLGVPPEVEPAEVAKLLAAVDGPEPEKATAMVVGASKTLGNAALNISTLAANLVTLAGSPLGPAFLGLFRG